MKKSKKTQKPVLICEDIHVYKDEYSYMVCKKVGIRNRRPTYHRTLSDAVHEVSLRLFNRKLADRAEAEQYDFNSLLQLVREHKEEMNKMFDI